MRLRVVGLAALAAASVVGCDSRVNRSNPFDPKAPTGVQAPARLEGTVSVESLVAFDGVLVRATEADAGSDVPLSYDAATATDGSFALEVPAGVFNMVISREGFISATINNIDAAPGQVRSLGHSHLVMARGTVTGTVSLDGGASATGTAISLIPLNITNGRIVTTLAGSDGSYLAEGLAAGEYAARAEREGYAPAYTPGLSSAGRQPGGTIVVSPQSVAVVPPLILYPAAAIVKVERGGLVQRHTNDPAIEVVLYPFVEFLTHMRVSSDPEFADASWDRDYRQFNSPVSFTLADRDGTHTIYAQFRDAYNLESDVFSTTIVLDRELPQVVTFEINDGAEFLTVEDGQGNATLGFTGRDELSGISGWRWTRNAAFDVTDAYSPVDSLGAVLMEVQTRSLGDENGTRTVLLQLRDRAGNESVVAADTIVRDHSAPVLGTPAIAIDPAELDANGAVRGLDVTLLFDVTGEPAGEPLFMAVANAQGLDGSSFFLPFTSPHRHTLASGSDAQAREVCALFRDAAGLMTEQQCLPVRVDRTGGITGRVLLEDVTGATGHGGVLVEVASSESGPRYTDITADDGSYTITGIPFGNGYGVRYFMDGYVEEFEWDVEIVAGAIVELGIRPLVVPRASVRGTLRYVDRGAGQHLGITVSDPTASQFAVTGPEGFFRIDGLLTNRDYDVTGRAQGYLPYTFPVVQNLVPGELRDLGSFTMQKERGDFRICAGDDDVDCSRGAIAFTKSRTVLLDVDSTHTYWRTNLGAFPDATTGWVTFVAGVQHLFTLGAGEADGSKAIYVQFADDDLGTGAEQPLAGVVTLDTTAPTPAATSPVVVNDGALYSNHPSGTVTVALGWLE
jgi:hypothetical protein